MHTSQCHLESSKVCCLNSASRNSRMIIHMLIAAILTEFTFESGTLSFTLGSLKFILLPNERSHVYAIWTVKKQSKDSKASRNSRMIIHMLIAAILTEFTFESGTLSFTLGSLKFILLPNERSHVYAIWTVKKEPY